MKLLEQLLQHRSEIAKITPNFQKNIENINSLRHDQNLIADFPQAIQTDVSSQGQKNVIIDPNAPIEKGARKIPIPTTHPHRRPTGSIQQNIEFKRITGNYNNLPENDPATKSKYVQVYVPAPQINRSQSSEYRIPITAFSTSAQKAFKGIEFLNQLQSAVFDCAYLTNNNMLVCAPTGAGKTNVALTTIVREIDQHESNMKSMKVIYIAPMKALAQEIVQKFETKLSPLGISVRELTGDMQLSYREIKDTQIIVTTPEKWDVITRKSGENILIEAVKLLIIDEVHLIGDDRGPVIESLIARTLRQIEQTQKMVRIIGLSATLPNYHQVARFLRVNPDRGLFYFDNSYRPVPLEQTFIGILEKSASKKSAVMNDIAFLKSECSVLNHNQVMVFVHSRNDTMKTARAFIEAVQRLGKSQLFSVNATNSSARDFWKIHLNQSQDQNLKQLFPYGIAIHHAGMLRSDRSLVEKMFSEGAVSVLCCTATLAWGVNLPAHTVIIKGTQIYVPERGGLVELKMQDVFQCFGRAGRPQFDTSGEAFLITEYNQLNQYVNMLSSKLPLESHLHAHLPDALNAEIVSGTVTNLTEACEWLSYTFLYVRMLMSPVAYGITYEERDEDPTLLHHRSKLIITAARELDRIKMSRFLFNESTKMSNHKYSDSMSLLSPLGVTGMGRIASHFYINYQTIENFNSKLKSTMDDAQIIDLLCQSSEFEQLRVREEDLPQLNKLKNSACPIEILAEPQTSQYKTNILLQCYITRAYIHNFTLSIEINYIQQNICRIARAVFEICLMKCWSFMSAKLLAICTAVDKRCWWEPYNHPLRQLSPSLLQSETVYYLESLGEKCSLENLFRMDSNEMKLTIQHPKLLNRILNALEKIPYLSVKARLQPINQKFLKISIDFTPSFTWVNDLHGDFLNFIAWIDDQNSTWIYHIENITLQKEEFQIMSNNSKYFNDEFFKDEESKQFVSVNNDSFHCIHRELILPIFEPLPSCFHLVYSCDNWFGSGGILDLKLDELILPKNNGQSTVSIKLYPLQISTLQNSTFEKFYEKKISHFDSVESQMFHVLYHSDNNILIGASSSSYKSYGAEITLMRAFRHYSSYKIVYITRFPNLSCNRTIKSLEKLSKTLGKNIIKLEGGIFPKFSSLNNADIIFAEAETWDRLTQNNKIYKLINSIKLFIVDQIHLIGENRGSILEFIVSKIRYICNYLGCSIRIVGLSMPFAFSQDFANWFGIKDGIGLFNFTPKTRSISLDAHILSFPEKSYGSRMYMMNKPIFQAILKYSSGKPVTIFVSCKNQIRATALHLISSCAAKDNPRQFLNIPFNSMETLVKNNVKDDLLNHTLLFGIGIYHDALSVQDKELVSNLFVSSHILIVICTSSMSWKIDFPTNLVIIKDTTLFNEDTHSCEFIPVTDILQMIEHAGRQSIDKCGTVLLLIDESLKYFYSNYLFDALPIESQIMYRFHNEINTEIVCRRISNFMDIIKFMSWTYYFRRLSQNPSYYGVHSNSLKIISDFLIKLISKVLLDLFQSGCVHFYLQNSNMNDFNYEINASISSRKNSIPLDNLNVNNISEKYFQNMLIEPTAYGKISSKYHLDYRTMSYISKFSNEKKYLGLNLEERLHLIFQVVSKAYEFKNGFINCDKFSFGTKFSNLLPWKVQNCKTCWKNCSHSKVFLLLQAHCMRLLTGKNAFISDLSNIFDRALSIIKAMIEIESQKPCSEYIITAMTMSQLIVQGHFWKDSSLLHVKCISKDVSKILTTSILNTSEKVNSNISLSDGNRLIPLENSLLTKAAHLNILGHFKNLLFIPELSEIDRYEIIQEVGKLPCINFAVNLSENKQNIISSISTLNYSSSTKYIKSRDYMKAQDFSWWILLSYQKKILAIQNFTGLPINKKVTFCLDPNISLPDTAYLICATMAGLDQCVNLTINENTE